MKKIVYLHAGAELYGADIVLLQLVKSLDKKLYEPFVILPCDGPLVEKFRSAGIKVSVMNYPILRRKYFNLKGLLMYIKDYFLYSIKLRRIIKENNIDIIHTNTAAVLEGIFIKLTMPKIKHIWHIHEIIVKPKFVNKTLSFLISKYADEVVVVSNAVKQHLHNTGFFKKPINVIYNGVDNNKFNDKNEYQYIKDQYNIPENAVIVGMIGRINAWKGQKDFLAAVNKILNVNPNVYAMLVGGVFEGEEWRKEELERQIDNMEEKQRIILSDYRNDTPNLYCLYDIFVLPSTNPDPLPTVVLEAMASGKPIVGYRHGGVCEMVEDKINGLLANVGDIDDLKDKINQLVNDKNLRVSMGKKSIERQKNKFSLESYTNNFERLYNA